MTTAELENFAYTDGACRGNPGPGGWGFVLQRPHLPVIERYGFEAHTTNNRMELQAVIEVLQEIKEGETITIFTDSQYVSNGMTQWLNNWLNHHWLTSDKKPVKNKDLWQTLHALTTQRRVKWQWVKGHSNNPGNQRADTLANLAIESLQAKRSEESC